MSYLFSFSYCLWGSPGKKTEVVCHSLFQWTTFCQTSPLWPICPGWPYTAWLSFIALDKAVVHVIRLVVFRDCGFSLSALWCPLLMPTILLGFLLAWAWDISSRLLQQSAATAPYLECGVSPLGYSPLQRHATTTHRSPLPRKSKTNMISVICGITDIENKCIVPKGKRNRGRDKLGVWDWQVHTIIHKIYKYQGFAL